MSITVELHDKETLLSAIQDVRKDDTDTNWCLIGHKDGNPNTLVVCTYTVKSLSQESSIEATLLLERFQYLILTTLYLYSWKELELTDMLV